MKTKLAALFAVMILSLAVAGTAYAAWTATLNINGTVKTGDFDMTITGSKTGYTAVDGDITVTGSGTTSITFVATNAYPGVTGDVEIKLHNGGTVPAQVKSVDWTTLPPPYDDDIDYTYAGDVPIPNTGSIAPGGDQVFTVHFTVKAEAVEGGTYTFTATFGFGLP